MSTPKHALGLVLALSLTACGQSHISPKVKATPPSQAQAAGALLPSRALIYSTLEVLGIGPVGEEALKAQGIRTVAQLLQQGGTRAQRSRLAKETGLSETRLLTWVNHADLMRITGCGPEYARLLELAGVDSVMELAKRDPGHLAEALAKANHLGGGKQAVERLPNVATTIQWVSNAKTYDRAVSH